MIHSASPLTGSSALNVTTLNAALRTYGQIIPTANTTTRAQLIVDLAALSPAITPSASQPIMVYRADAPTSARIEITEDGTNWSTVVGADSGWTAPASYGSGYSATNCTIRSRLIGNRVQLRGLLQPDTGTIATGSVASVATLAAGHRPAQQMFCPADCWVSGATTEHTGDASVKIGTDGTVTIYLPRTTTGVFVDGITFTTD